MNIEEKIPGFSEQSLRKIAAQKIKYRLFLRIHILLFIMINTFFFILNFTKNFTSMPRYYFDRIYWFQFPLFSWFIGLSVHATCYYCYAYGVYPIMKRIAFVHLVAYLTVMLFLFMIDFNIMGLKYSIEPMPDEWLYISFYIEWAHIVAIIWGFPMIIHVVLTLIYSSVKFSKDGNIKNRKERTIDKEIDKMKRKIGVQ